MTCPRCEELTMRLFNAAMTWKDEYSKPRKDEYAYEMASQELIAAIDELNNHLGG